MSATDANALGNRDVDQSRVSDYQDRPETPPPPYNIEDTLLHSTSVSHNPELAEMDAGAPYQIRGPLLSSAKLITACPFKLTFRQMTVEWMLI